MDIAVACKRVIESDAVADALTVDEDDDIGAQMTLVVEYVAAQSRIHCKRCFQCGAQGHRLCGDFRRLGETAQLLSENNFWHDEKLY